ncbi:MAG TPA: cyclic nucleotide-binding domain-containing protein [Actinomycetota bacterium]|nr:cyclic nucleotide-binding domain-containing protein [Actinomycetota bacterium]
MTKRADPTAALAAVPLFEDLAKKDLRQILDASKEVSFTAGRTIVEEGTTGVAFHLILEGTARVSVKGRTKAKLGPGDYFGEISLIDRGPRSATVSAETDVHTITLASWNFLSIIDHNPSIARKLLAGLCKRIRETERASAHTH